MATRAASPRWRLPIAFNVGVAGYLAGLVFSALFNTPTGAATVIALVPAGLVAAALIRRGHGHVAADGGDPAEATAPTLWPRIIE